MAQQNGICINLPASLGLPIVGWHWVALPPDGLAADLPDDVRAVLVEHSGTAQQSEERGVGSVKHLTVQAPAFEAAVEAAKVEAEARAAKRAEDDAKAERYTRQLAEDTAEAEAAVASPEPSRMLTRDDSPPWRPWQANYGAISYQPGNAADRLWSALKIEAVRRNDAIEAAREAEVAGWTDDALLAVEGGLPPVARSRRDQLHHAQQIELAATNQAALRAALVESGATDNQLARFDAGRLPEVERDALIEPGVWGELTDLVVSPRLTADDVEHGVDCPKAEPKFAAEDYIGELSAEQWEQAQVASAMATELGFVARIRRSSCWCRHDSQVCSGGTTERIYVLVTVSRYGLDFERRIALD
jgi:hypothetical protein